MFSSLFGIFNAPTLPVVKTWNDQRPSHKEKPLKARYIARDVKTALTHIKRSQKVGITREQKKHAVGSAIGILKSVRHRLLILDWE